MMIEKVRGRAVALFYGLTLAGCRAAHASGRPDGPGVYTFSAGRLGAMVAVLVGLTGVIIAGRALVRSGRRPGTASGGRGPIAAMVAGIVGIVLGGVVVATAGGGLGTGHGLGGGVVALVVGSIGVALGGLARVRSRRIS